MKSQSDNSSQGASQEATPSEPYLKRKTKKGEFHIGGGTIGFLMKQNAKRLLEAKVESEIKANSNQPQEIKKETITNEMILELLRFAASKTCINDDADI